MHFPFDLELLKIPAIYCKITHKRYKRHCKFSPNWEILDWIITITIVIWLFCIVGASLSVTDYAETNKVNGPTESCEEPELNPVLSCGNKVSLHSLSYSKPNTLTSHEVTCVKDEIPYTVFPVPRLKKAHRPGAMVHEKCTISILLKIYDLKFRCPLQ